MQNIAKCLTAEQAAKSHAAYMADGVRERIDQAAQCLGATMAVVLNDHVQKHAEFWTAFESPIEIIFFAWWKCFDVAHSMWHMGNIRGPMLNLMVQHEVDYGDRTYRLDFVVAPTVRSDDEKRFSAEMFPKIAIELDGHEFHEKTKTQVTYRNKRDRDLQQAGWRVFHVSGSELARQPMETTRGIYDHCMAEYEDFQYRVYKATDGTDPID